MTYALVFVSDRDPVIATDCPADYAAPEGWRVMPTDEAVALCRRADALRAVRATRDELLTASDWTQVADAPLPAAIVSAWRTYRQALRDLPSAADAAGNVEWPPRPR